MFALTYLNRLTEQLNIDRHRRGVMFEINANDQISLFERYFEYYIECQSLPQLKVAVLGHNLSFRSQFSHLIQSLSYKQGHQLLGQEISVLIVDCTDGFDANSFSAALGALVGGGIAFVVNFDQLPKSNSKVWLAGHFQTWVKIKSLDLVENSYPLDTHLQIKNQRTEFCTPDQVNAINAIKRVISGHRKRPLVINANRGRGKTSCLGMAAMELMFEQSCTIIVTAPTIKSVKPLFEHVQLRFDQLISDSNQIDLLDNKLFWERKSNSLWLLSNGARLQFCAPDDVLINKPDADLLIVDEAAALPLASLQQMIAYYHRTVFSSTTHGYEGCGRGFTLKFMNWLNLNRPGWKQVELKTPIRWNDGDPLEAWLFDTLLLDADKQRSSLNLAIDQLSLHFIKKSQLLNHPVLLRDIFGLLVHAHYQTSPNDLLQILDEEHIEVIQVYNNEFAVGCILLNREGCLDTSTIHAIQTGKRRPKGHLAASYLCNHLGITEAASQKSARIMRIAIEPSLQGLSIGSQVLQLLKQKLFSKVDFISVSFGATAELVRFWSQQFKVVSLGTRRDQASGCYSTFMLCPLSDKSRCWIEVASKNFMSQLKVSLPIIYPKLDNQCLVSLLHVRQVVSNLENSLIKIPVLVANYADGGNSYETVYPSLHYFIWQLLSQPVSSFLSLKATNLSVDNFILDKVLFNMSWGDVAVQYDFTGRKEIEASLREFLINIIDNIKLL